MRRRSGSSDAIGGSIPAFANAEAEKSCKIRAQTYTRACKVEKADRVPVSLRPGIGAACVAGTDLHACTYDYGTY